MNFRERSSVLAFVLGLFFLAACFDPWVPTGGIQGTVSRQECESFYLEKKLGAMGSRVDEKIEYLENFFKRCEGQFDRKVIEGGFIQLLTDISASYKIETHRSYRKLIIELNSGYKMPAHLMLKSGNKKYPLVIYECGANCDSTTESFSFFATTFFDEGPFHVLLLPSSSSSEWQLANKSVSFGGYDEGLRVLETAKWLKLQSAYRSRISSVHLLGTSLGGHTALYAALYNGYLKMPNGGDIIDSTIAGCPVVNLKLSIEDVLNSEFIGSFFYSYFYSQVQKIQNQDTVLAKIAKAFLTKASRASATEFIAEGNVAASRVRPELRSHEEALDLSLLPDELRNREYLDTRDYWEKNRFQDFAHLMKKDILIWATGNDMVVRTAANSGLLESESRELRNEHYKFLHSQYGNHCSWSLSYGHRVAGTILRDYFLSFSPELKGRAVEKVVQLEDLSFRTQSMNPILLVSSPPLKRVAEWRVSEGSSTAKIIERIERNCTMRGYEKERPQRCEEEREIEVPLNELGLNVPQGSSEAESLTRFLNVHGHFVYNKDSIFDARGDLNRVYLKYFD